MIQCLLAEHCHDGWNDSVTSCWALPWMIQWQQLSTAINDTVTVVEHCYNKWISYNTWALTPIIQWQQFEQYPSMIQWPLLTTAIMNDPVTSVQHWSSDYSWALASTIQWLQSSSDHYSWALPSVIPRLQLSIATKDPVTCRALPPIIKWLQLTNPVTAADHNAISDLVYIWALPSMFQRLQWSSDCSWPIAINDPVQRLQLRLPLAMIQKLNLRIAISNDPVTKFSIALPSMIQWLQLPMPSVIQRLQLPMSSVIQRLQLSTAISYPVTTAEHCHQWSSDYGWALPSVIQRLHLSTTISDPATTAEHCRYPATTAQHRL